MKLRSSLGLTSALAVLALGGCATGRTGNVLPPASFVGSSDEVGENYQIGPPTSSASSCGAIRSSRLASGVRPDGRITTQLITDMIAVGKTPAQLADDVRVVLSQYIQEPIVTVTVEKAQGTLRQQIRIVGATEKPARLPYRANMTLLDAMIAVGGPQRIRRRRPRPPGPHRPGDRAASANMICASPASSAAATSAPTSSSSRVTSSSSPKACSDPPRPHPLAARTPARDGRTV
jgi:polysaccharide export outer membrane protein